MLFSSDYAREFQQLFDPRHGGFGSAPKFPRQTLLELLRRLGATIVPSGALVSRFAAAWSCALQFAALADAF